MNYFTQYNIFSNVDVIGDMNADITDSSSIFDN